MELIEALERLSLHVKSSQKRFSQNVSINNHSGANLSEQSTQDDDWLHSSTTGDQYHRFQLDQFEDSIETLFSQINDLNHSDQGAITSIGCRRRASESAIVSKDHSLRREKFHYNGSLETSQEEDSDNSSQQSICGNTTNINHSEQLAKMNCSTQSLVLNLMKRDINSITESVRNICRILALGSEIESIYKKHFLNKPMIAPCQPQTSMQHFDPQTCRALCESFLELCSSEPYVCDLPTIMRFTKQCQMLMQQINLLLPTTRPETNTAKLENLDQYFGQIDCQRFENRDHEDQMCLDEARDALDCALLECDQRQLDDNWTDNKLYVDNETNR